MKKEKSSILTPNNELIGVKKSEKKEEAKIPKPTGWRILVLPFKMKEKSKGGVHFAEATLEKQQVASQCGLVLAMGPQCYKDKDRYRRSKRRNGCRNRSAETRNSRTRNNETR